MADTISLGYRVIMGLGDESAWGTEAVATQRVPLISTTLDGNPALLRSVTLEGRYAERPPDQGNIVTGGDLVEQLRYSLGNLLLKHTFGSLVSGVYTLGSRRGLGLTIAVDKQISVSTFTGGKIGQFVLASTLERVSATYTVQARQDNRASVLNTQAVLQALEDCNDNVLHRHLNWRVGTQAAALTSLNEVAVPSWTWTLARPIDQVFTNEGQSEIEAADNGFPTCTIAFPTARHISNQWKDWQDAFTPLQARAFFTDPASARRFEILFPSVYIQSDPVPVAGPGVLTDTITLHATEGLSCYTSTFISALASDNSLNIAASVAATNTLTLDTQPTAGDTDTIGGKLYTWDANGALVNTNGHIEIGATLGASQTNKRNAVNLTGTPGTGYAAAMTINPSVSLGAFVANVATLTAKTAGAAGNSIGTTETFTAVTNIFSSATLTGGSGDGSAFPLAFRTADARISGFATPGNNGNAVVVSWTANKLVLSGMTLADEAVGPTVAVDIRNPMVVMIET
jgi:hypothetical protein